MKQVTLWCHGRDKYGNRCHVPGTEERPDLLVIAMRQDSQGVKWYYVECQKCGKRHWSDKAAAAELPRRYGIKLEMGDIQIPRIWGR